MAKKTTNQFPKPGKCDPVEGILLGNQIPKNLQREIKKTETPEDLIKKLSKIVLCTSDENTKNNAEKAISFLSQLRQKTPIKDQDRIAICNKVYMKKEASQ